MTYLPNKTESTRLCNFERQNINNSKYITLSKSLLYIYNAEGSAKNQTRRGAASFSDRLNICVSYFKKYYLFFY